MRPFSRRDEGLHWTPPSRSRPAGLDVPTYNAAECQTKDVAGFRFVIDRYAQLLLEAHVQYLVDSSFSPRPRIVLIDRVHPARPSI